jgi:hypothetical protein
MEASIVMSMCLCVILVILSHTTHSSSTQMVLSGDMLMIIPWNLLEKNNIFGKSNQ